MRLESKKYLYDILHAAKLAAEFNAGVSLDEYIADAKLKAATERQFEIIGEALRHVARDDPGIAEGISEYERIIAFRNILIHGYATVDDRVVFDVVRSKLPTLLDQVTRLLD